MDIRKIRIDRKLEEEGVWFPWLEDVSICVRSTQPDVFQNARAAARVKNREILSQVGLTKVADDFHERMMRELTGEFLIVGWKNIEEDGEMISATRANRIRLCTDDRYRDLFVFVTACANSMTKFREAQDAQLVGKHEPMLDGVSSTAGDGSSN